MLSDVIIQGNLQSWRDLEEFVESLNTAQLLAYRELAQSLLRDCVALRLDRYFRAGQSMWDLIFSTAEQHGLENIDPPPPRVTFGLRQEGAFVATSDCNLWFNEADRLDDVTSGTAFSVLKLHLKLLWDTTRFDESNPIEE